MERELQVKEYLKHLEHQEMIEHRDVLLAISAVMQTKEGKELFAYLFKNFEVGTMPPQHLDGKELFECLGFLRAGNSLFKLVSEANSEGAASLLAKLERKRYEQTYEQYRIENGLNHATTDE